MLLLVGRVPRGYTKRDTCEFLPEKRALFGADVFVFNKVVAQYADAARYESE